MILRHTVLLWLCVAVLLPPPPSRAAGTTVTGQAVDYAGSEGEMPAQLYVPDGTGRLPGILVFHTLAGPGPNVNAFARELASAGYVTLAPDVFALHDFGPDGRTDHPLILGDVAGALAYLERHPRVNPDRVGVVGFSFGGRLAVLTGHTEYEVRALRALRPLGDLMAKHPTGFGRFLCALDFNLGPRVEIALVVPASGDGRGALAAEVFGRYLPNRVVTGTVGGGPTAGIPLLEGRGPMDGRATAYVCRNYACDLPATDRATLARQLDAL